MHAIISTGNTSTVRNWSRALQNVGHQMEYPQGVQRANQSFVGATVSSEHSTSAISHQVRPGGISYTVNHTWFPSAVGRVMDVYTVFWE